MENKQVRWERRIQRYYSLSPEQYTKILAAQNGVCGICELPCSTWERLSVDHNHDCCPGKTSCGKCVRGLLCHLCNASMGGFKNDPILLERAVEWSKR